MEKVYNRSETFSFRRVKITASSPGKDDVTILMAKYKGQNITTKTDAGVYILLSAYGFPRLISNARRRAYDCIRRAYEQRPVVFPPNVKTTV